MGCMRKLVLASLLCMMLVNKKPGEMQRNAHLPVVAPVPPVPSTSTTSILWRMSFINSLIRTYECWHCPMQVLQGRSQDQTQDIFFTGHATSWTALMSLSSSSTLMTYPTLVQLNPICSLLIHPNAPAIILGHFSSSPPNQCRLIICCARDGRSSSREWSLMDEAKYRQAWLWATNMTTIIKAPQ